MAEDFWYRLDNAGKLYPSITTPYLTTVFRLSVSLKKPVKISRLQEALENIIGRFPYYRVYLHKGIFWYYLEHTRDIPKILPDTRYPCAKIPVKRKGTFLFKVKVYKTKIAVEYFHALTDGTGGMNFLKALTAEYISLVYGPFDEWGDIFRPGQIPDPEEAEDSFIKYYNPKASPPLRVKKAFHIPYKNLPLGIYNVITGIVPLGRLSEISKENNATINDFLIAVLFEALQNLYFRINKPDKNIDTNPITIMIPVNMRKIFGSKTMRNFSLFLIPGIDPEPGRYSFGEIVNYVHHYVRMNASARSVQPDMARNVKGERNIFIRALPLFLKNILLSGIYKIIGGKGASSGLSNIGIVMMPDRIAAYIDRFDFILPPEPTSKCNCSVVSFRDKVSISFGRTIIETDIEKYFFRRLVGMGIPVKIENN
ncbi:MAG: hypothetical protein ABSG94_01495 [Brevinematales bacterium]|jgi:hypothetical protein